MAGRSQLAAAESMGVEIFVRPHPPNCSSPKIYAALDSSVMSDSSPAPGDALKRHKGRLREYHFNAISALTEGLAASYSSLNAALCPLAGA